MGKPLHSIVLHRREQSCLPRFSNGWQSSLERGRCRCRRRRSSLFASQAAVERSDTESLGGGLQGLFLARFGRLKDANKGLGGMTCSMKRREAGYGLQVMLLIFISFVHSAVCSVRCSSGQVEVITSVAMVSQLSSEKNRE
jgi:hypothetical protein